MRGDRKLEMTWFTTSNLTHKDKVKSKVSTVSTEIGCRKESKRLRFYRVHR